MKLSIVLCTRNQRQTIQDTLQSFGQLAPPRCEVELVVVDNGSTDGTPDILCAQRSANLKVIYQPRPKPGVSCWHSAIAHLAGEYALLDRVPLDAESFATLIEEAEDGIQAIYASPGREGNRDLTTRLVNTLFGGNLNDVVGASKLVNVDVLKRLNLKGEGDALEVSLTARLLQAGIHIRQVELARSVRTPGAPRPRFGMPLGAALGAFLDLSPVWKAGMDPTRGAV